MRRWRLSGLAVSEGDEDRAVEVETGLERDGLTDPVDREGRGDRHADPAGQDRRDDLPHRRGWASLPPWPGGAGTNRAASSGIEATLQSIGSRPAAVTGDSCT